MSASKETTKTTKQTTDIRVPIATPRKRDKKYQEVAKPKQYSEALNVVKLKTYMNDPHVLSCYQSRTAGVTMHEWDVKIDNDNTYIADYVRSVLNKLKMHTILSQMLEAVAYGYAVHEIIYQKTKSESGFEYLTVVDLAQRPQEWFSFDNVGQLLYSSGSAKIPVPGDKVIITRNNATASNPYGFAVLGACKLAIEQKLIAIKGLMTFVEKYAMPYVDVKVDKLNLTDDDLTNLVSLAEGLLEDGVTAHSNNIEIAPLKFNDAASVSIYIDTINQANNEISKAILSQTMTTENTSGTGSYAMSKTHSVVRQDLIENDRKLVEQSINKLIELICEKRFGKLDVYPYFALYEESFIDKSAAETAALLLQNPNLRLTNKFYERFGLSAEEFELIESPNPQSAPTAFNEFAEKGKTKKNILKIAEENEKITDLIDLITTDSKFGAEMQFETMNDMLKSVIDVVENADSYNDIIDKLPSQFKEMNSKKFNEFMTKLLLISKVHGQNAVTREVE